VINTETTTAMSLHTKQTDFLETTSHLKIWILPTKENLNSQESVSQKIKKLNTQVW
jgi:hypothetical protein